MQWPTVVHPLLLDAARTPGHTCEAVTRAQKLGPCHICGEHGPLTFEHVPPEVAFNDRRVVLTGLDEWLASGGALDGRRGRYLQRGAGGYTLCGKCNSTTGAWYVPEYGRWAQRLLPVLLHAPTGIESAHVVITGGRPLRFLKQAITMVFSANGSEFGRAHPDLVRFVREPATQDLPTRYDVFLALLRWSKARSCGLAARVDTVTGRTTMLTEVAHPPFAVVLTIDAPEAFALGRITAFAGCELNEQREIELDVRLGEVATPYPGDYRSRVQAEREAAALNER